MKVSFFAPSYKRPERSITQKNYPQVKLVVRDSEAEEYIKNGNEIIIVPDSAQGNVSRIRNYIMNNLMGDNDAIVVMDDDCSGVFRWEEGKKVKLTPDELQFISEDLSNLCSEWGYKMWGLSCVPDKMSNREGTPFNTLNFIGGPFQGIIKGNEIQYDEELSLKEDYDFTLQHIRKYNGCLRVNYLCYDVKQAEQSGGCATYRNSDKEKQQFEALQKKWGSKVIRRDKKSKRDFDFNPKLIIPLKGV
jgi:hypothetical protein